MSEPAAPPAAGVKAAEAGSHPEPGARHRAWLRGLLAGPVCFATAGLVMAGAALWLPKGPASIDNIVLPMALFPLIWALLFFYLLLDRRLGRAWLVAVLLLAGHGALIASRMYAATPPPAPAAAVAAAAASTTESEGMP